MFTQIFFILSKEVFIETVGWTSTILFLISIIMPARVHLHALGVATSVTTAFYAYAHEATAIWVKWIIALFFHLYMWYKIYQSKQTKKI